MFSINVIFSKHLFISFFHLLIKYHCHVICIYTIILIFRVLFNTLGSLSVLIPQLKQLGGNKLIIFTCKPPETEAKNSEKTINTTIKLKSTLEKCQKCKKQTENCVCAQIIDYSCLICKKNFKTKKALEEHCELHEDNPNPCTDCRLSYKTLTELAVHSIEHHLKFYKCPICVYKTPTKRAIQFHIQRHERNYRFTCEICGKGFVDRTHYKEHVEGHDGIKKFACDLCDKRFLYKTYLQVHVRLNHRSADELFRCHVCRKEFTFKKSLTRHLSLVHNVGRNLSSICQICGKLVTTPYSLKVHMRTHTGEVLFVCEICGKAFAKRAYLKRHLKKHCAVNTDNNTVEAKEWNLSIILMIANISYMKESYFLFNTIFLFTL